jgi:hypothetical protein
MLVVVEVMTQQEGLVLKEVLFLVHKQAHQMLII